MLRHNKLELAKLLLMQQNTEIAQILKKIDVPSKILFQHAGHQKAVPNLKDRKTPFHSVEKPEGKNEIEWFQSEIAARKNKPRDQNYRSYFLNENEATWKKVSQSFYLEH